MSNLKELLEGKKSTDFTREQLEQMAKDHGVSFEEKNQDETLFKRLVATYSEKPKEKSGKKIKVKILISPAGKFLLPYSVGEVVSVPEAQANELIESKYAEKVK